MSRAASEAKGGKVGGNGGEDELPPVPADRLARARAALIWALPFAVSRLVEIMRDDTASRREQLRASEAILDRAGLPRSLVVDMLHEVRLTLPPGMAPAQQLPIVPTGLLPPYPGDDEVEEEGEKP